MILIWKCHTSQFDTIIPGYKIKRAGANFGPRVQRDEGAAAGREGQVC